MHLKHTNRILSESKHEFLPRLTDFLNVNTAVIVNTILNRQNFRIWDMAIRGFAREKAFEKFARNHSLEPILPTTTGRERADKADHAIYSHYNNSYIYFQTKGVSTNNCTFEPDNLVVAVETQLTRGRVNDHQTQSRLYLRTDFDYLIIGLDPALVYTYRRLSGHKAPSLEWEFYAIPTANLESHHQMAHRLKSLQKIKYEDLQKYKINQKILDKWLS